VVGTMKKCLLIRGAGLQEIAVLHEEVQLNNEICCNSKTNKKRSPIYRLATLELDSGGLVAS